MDGEAVADVVLVSVGLADAVIVSVGVSVTEVDLDREYVCNTSISHTYTPEVRQGLGLCG